MGVSVGHLASLVGLLMRPHAIPILVRQVILCVTRTLSVTTLYETDLVTRCFGGDKIFSPTTSS